MPDAEKEKTQDVGSDAIINTPSKSIDPVNEIPTDITLIKCAVCGKNYFAEFTHPIKIKEPHHESYRIVKRYLCDECFERLQRAKWVKTIEAQDKKNEQKEEDGY